MEGVIPNVTISGLGRAMDCPPSLLLPQSPREGDYAGRGNVIHAFLASIRELGYEAALEAVPTEHREACKAIDVSRLPASDPKAWAAEVAFAYNVRDDTGRELGRGLERDYSGLRPGELAGTADVVGLTEDAVHILDYKTGYSDLGPVAKNWQLLGLAVAATRTYGKSFARVGIIRILEDGSSWTSWADLGPWELDRAAEEVADLLFEKVPAEAAWMASHHGQPKKLSPSEKACRYCPAFASCPAQVGLLRAFVDGEPLPVLNDETGPLVYERIKLVEKALEAASKSLREYAQVTPIQLGDGYVYGAVQWPEEVADPLKVATVLTERYGREVAEAAVEQKPSYTKSGLERGLKAYKERIERSGVEHEKMSLNGKNGLVPQALEAMRSAGASKQTFSTQVRKHKPKTEKK